MKTEQEPKWFKNLKDITDYQPVPQDENALVISMLSDLQYDMRENIKYDRFSKWNKRDIIAEGGIALYKDEMESRKWLKSAQKHYKRGILQLMKRLKDSMAYQCVHHKPVYDLMMRSSDDTFLYFYSKL